MVGSLLARDWLVTRLFMLPNIPALFMTSLVQTARHKMATLEVVLVRLSNVFFNKKKSSEKLLCLFCLFVCFTPSLLLGPVALLSLESSCWGDPVRWTGR